MGVPDDYKYTKDHEWVSVADGVATVGITEYAQSELGELVFVELPAAGSSIAKGDSFCVVESTKAASDVYAPISGTVQEVNSTLEDEPALINGEPFTGGWIIKLTDLKEDELGSLLSASEYQDLIS